MREALNRLTCDLCGLSVTVAENTDRKEYADGWKEFDFDDFGHLRSRYLELKDICPECFKRLWAAAMEIKQEGEKKK